MPELPEAETIARELARLAVGRRLLGWRTLTPGICERRTPYPRGAKLAAVSRRAKKVILHFDNGASFLVALGMSGQLRRGNGPPLPRHTHVVLSFAGGVDVLYVDPRRLGRLTPSRPATTLLAAGPAVRRWCDERLGVDALDVSWPDFRARLAGRRGAFKPLLLNQRVIAGIGNIYADEILHRAGVHPRTPPAALTDAALRRVWRATRAVLRQAVRDCGTTFRDYITPSGAAGDFGRRLHVYGREGKPCRRCGARVVRIGWPPGRSTHYCPRCQRPRS